MWIHTLYVELEGAPAIDDGDGDEGGSGDGSGSGESGDGGADGSGASGGDVPSDASQTNADETAQSTSSVGLLEGAESSGEGNGGRFSIFQVLNNHDSETESTLENPVFFEYVAIPLGVGAMIAGAAQSVMWFRREMWEVALLQPDPIESA